MNKQSSFVSGPILSTLMRFALPVLGAMILQAMYGAVDLMVVGQFASAGDVSAVSTGSQLMQTITSVIVGLSMGTTILVGQTIGEGRADRTGSIIGSSVWLFGGLGLIAVLAGIILMRKKRNNRDA